MIKTWEYVLVSSKGEFVLDHNPIKWEGSENILNRMDEYDGIFNEYSVSDLEFIGKAKDWLIDLRKTEGIFLVCTIEVRRRNYLTRLVSTEYIGILNAKTYKVSGKNGGTVSMKIGESSVHEKILSRASNVISYDNEKSVNGVNLPAIYPKYNLCTIQGNEIITKVDGVFQDFHTGFERAYNLTLLGSIVSGNNQNVINTPLVTFTDKQKDLSNGSWLYKTENRTSKVDVNLSCVMNIGSNTFVKFVIAEILDVPVDIDGYPIDLNPDWIGTVTEVYKFGDGGGYTTYNETFSFTMPANHALIVYVEADFEDPESLYLARMDSSSLELIFTELPVTKTIDTIRSFDLAKRVINSITDNEAEFSSSILDSLGEYENVLHFNGFMARGFDSSISNYAISLDDIVNSFKPMFNVGLGIIDNTVFIEDVSAFYLDEIVLVIDRISVNTWTHELDEKKFISNIKAGYKKTEYEEGSGLEEYNNLNEYNTPIGNTKSKLELIPKMRGDGYGITYAIDTPADTSETTDTKYDKEVFFIDAKKGVVDYVQKGREGFSKVEGIDQITIPININFTPARMAVRSSERFAICIEIKPTVDIQFANSSVFTDLVTRKSGETIEITENGNIPFSNLKTARKSGFKSEFEWTLSFEEFAYIKANKYGRCQYRDPVENIWRYGWFKRVAKTSTNKKATFVIEEQFNGTDPNISRVLGHSSGAYVVTDNNEKISVNG
jgi:hypothetical protein